MVPVLHLRSGSGLYGAERALLALAAETPAPYSPIIFALARDGSAGALAREAERLDLPVERFICPRRVDLRCAQLVARRARKRGARLLLHAHDYKSLCLALVASPLCGANVVATFHGDTGATPPLRVYESLARALANFTRGVAVVSRPLERRLRRWVWAAPVVFIPNGIPSRARCSEEERAAARSALGLRSDEFVLGAVGRLSPEKGHSVLLRSLRDLPRPPATLIVGDGPMRAELEQSARGLPVRFLGHLADARSLYAAADVVVLPSLCEGLPLVALEAAASGRCVLASAVGELPEVLGGGAGVLVPPGNARALARAIVRIESDPWARTSAAFRAAERVRERYSAGAMAAAYARDLYAPALRCPALTAATQAP